MGLMTIGGALAFGEVSRPTDNSIVMNYDTVIREVTDSPRAEKYGVQIFFTETDDKVGVSYKIIDNKTLGLSVLNAPFIVRRSYPLIYCTKQPIVKYRNYLSRVKTRCPKGFSAYQLEDIVIGKETTLIIPPFSGNDTQFLWYIGSGAGGGGLPGCNYKFSYISISNQSIYVGNTTIVGHKVYYSGTNCFIPTSLEWQQRNDGSAWRSIPSNNVTNTNVNCDGSVCNKGSPISWSTWYYKTVECDGVGNRSLRNLMISPYNTIYASNTRVLECRRKKVIPEEDEGLGVWWIYAFPFFFGGLWIWIMNHHKNKRER